MRFRYFCSIMLLTLYLTIFFIGSADASDSIKWYSYDEGTVLGRTEKKKVFLHFYADWCGFCLKMAKETFQDAAVVSYLNKHFIAIRVDFDREPATAEKFGVMGLPSNWFLADTGQPIARVPGFIPPEALLPMLKQVNEMSKDD